MKYPLILPFLIIVLSTLSACIASNTDYVTANSLEPIVLPENVDGERLGELYPVPAGEAKRLQISTPLPPTVGAQSGLSATAFTLGERLWLLNTKTPATTWSQLLEFWQAEQIDIASQNVPSASMQSAWFTAAVQPGFEVRYQLVLSRGLQYDSTEIHLINQVRQQGSAETPWGLVSDNPNHTQWLLERLERFLNTRPDALNDSFLASTLNLPARVSYSESAQEPMLLINIDDERAVPVFSRAMQQSPLHLYAVDPSRTIYHINVIEPDQSTGLLSRLNPFTSQQPLQSPYSLPEILANIATDKAEVASAFTAVAPATTVQRLSNVPGYLVVVSTMPSGDKQMIVRNGYGEYLPLDSAKLLIDTIRRQLR